jgi:hypothetical protein
MVNNKAIVINGNKARLLFKPGIDNVLRVINKFVNEIVLLIPAKITDTINISWLPIFVYLVLDESGVTKAQPAVVNVRSEHFVKKTFLRRD